MMQSEWEISEVLAELALVLQFSADNVVDCKSPRRELRFLKGKLASPHDFNRERT